MRVAYETMLAEFERVLKKYGFTADRAHDAAEIFAQNSLAGVFSHGLNRFPVAVDYLKKGEIDPAAEAECVASFGSIKDIRQYIELAMQGDDTIDTRLEMFRHQREVLTQQIQQLQHTLETVEYKCWFYETAKATGTVDVPGAMTDADVPEQFRAIRQELRGQSEK